MSSTRTSSSTPRTIRQFFEAGQAWLQPPAAAECRRAPEAVADRLGIEIPPATWPPWPRKFPPELEETLLGLIGKVSTPGIILSKSLFIQSEPERGFTLVGPRGPRAVRVDDILEIKEAKGRIAAEVNALDLPAREEAAHQPGLFLPRPQHRLHKAETESRKGAASRSRPSSTPSRRARSSSARATKPRPKPPSGSGSSTQLLRKAGWLPNFAGTFLLFGLLFVTLWFYLKSLLGAKPAGRKFTMMGVMLLLGLLIYRLASSLPGSSRDARLHLRHRRGLPAGLPLPVRHPPVRLPASDHLALIYAILNSLMRLCLRANYFLLIFCFIGGLAAIYGVKV